MHVVLNRRKVVAAGVLLVVFTGWLVWWMQPDRRLTRSWNALIDRGESQRAAAIGRLLADDYSDRWGYTRDSLTEDFRLAFFHFDQLRVETTQVHVERVGDSATISATVRVETVGTPRANEGRLAVNRLFDPFIFEWRREESFPWSWKLEKIDHPSFQPMRFRRW